MSLERLTPKPFMSQAGKEKSNDSYTVRISTSQWGVEGVSKNPFNFKLSAKYGDLFQGLIPGAEVLQKTGNASLTTGIFSQKYFQGGNNLDMNVEFRIYDKGLDDINPVIKGARQLSNMTVAKAFQVAGTVEEAINIVGDKVRTTGTAIKGVIEGDKTFTGAVAGGIQSVVDQMNKRAVTLSIMNLFTCRGMVIQDVSVTYSSSQTHTGPLYGDFSVGLISLRAITQGGGDYGVNGILNNPSNNIRIDGLDVGMSGPVNEGILGGKPVFGPRPQGG